MSVTSSTMAQSPAVPRVSITISQAPFVTYASAEICSQAPSCAVDGRTVSPSTPQFFSPIREPPRVPSAFTRADTVHQPFARLPVFWRAVTVPVASRRWLS